LLPNWPLGILITAGGIIVAYKKLNAQNRNTRNHSRILVFTLLYIVVSIYAQSSTTNLNSGATTGIARYALWYLPLFFPLIVSVLAFAAKNKGFIIPLLSVATALSLLNIYSNFPTRPESYTSPSQASLFIQSQAPWAYNPPPEVFAERYSGVGEQVNQSTPRAILGPDCSKVLVFPGIERTEIFAPKDCELGLDTLDRIESLASSIAGSPPKYFYIK
jgi:hypothetical protein